MKFGFLVKQSQHFNRDYFHDNWCPICDFMEFWIFWKKDVVYYGIYYGRGIYYIHQGNFGIEFGQNRLKHSNFFRFWIFWELFQSFLTQANFDLASWNFVHKCTNTEWCLILNFIRIVGDLYILDEFDFFIFFIVTSNYKHSMYPRSFLCEEAKIKQRSLLKKELCEIGEEAIWESRFTYFLLNSEILKFWSSQTIGWGCTYILKVRWNTDRAAMSAREIAEFFWTTFRPVSDEIRS